MQYLLKSVGTVFAGETGFGIQLEPQYRAALEGLEGFSHVQVLWWATQCDTAQARAQFTEHKPYSKGPETLGTFATRSPLRPNPIGITTALVTGMDCTKGMLSLAWIDAFDGTPVLDIKPYTPAVDRVEAPQVPEWCCHWPGSVEASGEFDWESEFNF